MRSRAQASLVALALLARAASADVIERVLAVVDETPVLLSETVALQRLKPLDREAALQALIDELLMLREASRLREAAATREEEQRAYESLLARLEPGAAGVDEDALRRIAEVPVTWRNDAASRVTFLRGSAAFLDLARIRWNGLLGRYGA